MGAKLEDYWNFANCPCHFQLIDELFIEYRESPISVFGVMVDCDEDSLNTMRQTLKYFDEQPPVLDVFEIINSEKCVVWRLADNTQQALNKATLEAFLIEAEKEKALRTAKLYAKKRQFKDNGGTYAEVLSSWL